MFGDILINSKSWNTKPLGHLGKFKTGGTPSSKHPEYFEGDIPWISSTALGSNYINSSVAKYLITEDAVRNSATSLIPAGSLIIGTRINVGESSINTDAICTCQDITSMYEIDESLDLLFLKHCLDKFIPYLDSQKKGATIRGITSELLKSITIPLPPKELQNQYSTFVKQVDKSKFVIHFVYTIVNIRSIQPQQENYHGF
ncbi:MAG: type restriction enzyme subunit [Candidatus Methanomethylophilaceae archaeon]|nr:type restriction enzyme subunit [Candidatus Methanomethylophilaceae archaeon]